MTPSEFKSLVMAGSNAELGDLIGSDAWSALSAWFEAETIRKQDLEEVERQIEIDESDVDWDHYEESLRYTVECKEKLFAALRLVKVP